MNILFIGDITGKPGRQVLKDKLYSIKKEFAIDFVIANGENISHGTGMTLDTLRECENSGVDFFTSGNHAYRQVEMIPHFDEDINVIRPANYPAYYPGRGFDIVDVEDKKLLIINLIGQVFMGADIENPFRLVDKILLEHAQEADYIFVDMHAEATSEKVAMGFYLDGRVDAVVGTHTHIQTADNQIFPKGTAYITDVGMTGPKNSVLWVKPEISIEKALYPFQHVRFEMQEDGPRIINAVVVTIDETSGQKQIVRVNNTY